MSALTTQSTEPRQFTLDDVVRDNHIYVSYNELAHCPLWWHTLGLSQTASGYGRKLTSAYKISFEGKLYRLYHTYFSNAGTVWFTVRGKRYYVS